MTEIYGAGRLQIYRERQHPDRRSHHMQSLFYSLIKRRRVSMRRESDRHTGHYVDMHEPRVVFYGVAILVMSSMDAYFTLLLLPHGAYEINPLMNLLIEIDFTLFIKTKIAITAFCVVFLIAHKNFWLVKNIIRVNTVLFMAAVMYFALVNYQLGILMLNDWI